jgi:hypothetical protein
MAPIERPNGKTVWTKCGTLFMDPRAGNKYEGKLYLTSMPIGAVAPLELFLFPSKKYKDGPDEQR